MKRRAVIGAFTLCMSCGSGPYPGFSEVEPGVYLRHHVLGDGDAAVQDGDSLHLWLRMALDGEATGSWLSTDAWYAAEDLRQGALVPVMARVQEGDSMSLIAAAHRYPWEVVARRGHMPPAGAEMVRAELKVLRHRSAADIAATRERARHSDPEEFERRLIGAFIQRSGLAWERWGSSWFHHRIHGVPVDTARVRPGDRVELRWRGNRLEDGRMVDVQWDAPEPFSFRFGDTDQVVEGLEVAVSLLREGQEGEFIIPASMAFGDRGVAGLVEPWTPLRYTVRLERVVRAPA